MEGPENNPEEKTISKIQPIGKERTQQSPFLFLYLCVAVSIAAGALSGWWFSGGNKEIITIDVKKIVEEKRQELQAKYQKAPTEETAAAMEVELTAFLNRLEEGINNAGADGQLVLLSDVVLGGKKKDVTKEVGEYAKGQ